MVRGQREEGREKKRKDRIYGHNVGMGVAVVTSYVNTGLKYGTYMRDIHAGSS